MTCGKSWVCSLGGESERWQIGSGRTAQSHRHNVQRSEYYYYQCATEGWFRTQHSTFAIVLRLSGGALTDHRHHQFTRTPNTVSQAEVQQLCPSGNLLHDRKDNIVELYSCQCDGCLRDARQCRNTPPERRGHEWDYYSWFRVWDVLHELPPTFTCLQLP